MSWDWNAGALAALEAFLVREGLFDCAPEPRRIGDGHSNLTYRIRVKGGDAVLRRPPPPPVPKGANDVMREARILSALSAEDVPTPGVLAVAQAGEVLDVPFYVMDHVPGHVVTGRLPAGFDAARDGEAMSLALVDGLAKLHAVDWRSCGLGDFGQPENFNLRHLKRVEALMNQRDGKTPAWLADMASTLKAVAPSESGASIVHNDYRIGNVIWSEASPPALLAILDWELSTIGDPLLDLGYFVCCHPVAGADLTPTQELSAAMLHPGFPPRESLIEHYASQTKRDVSKLAWYAAMASWKLAVLYDYQHRLGNDAYYADPGQARSFIRAAEGFARAL